MKIKIAVEFEVDIGEYTDQKLDIVKTKIINAVQSKHKHIIPTGEWCFVPDNNKAYNDGIFYD